MSLPSSIRRTLAIPALALVAMVITATATFAHAYAPAIVLKAPPPGTLWVSNYGDDSLVSYPPGASGNVTPVATIVGDDTGLDQPSGLAIDRNGQVWTANYGANTITAYDALSNGDAPPTVTIAGPNTELNHPLGIAITRGGNLWVADGGDSTLLEFASGAHGNVAPTRQIGGSKTGIAAAASVAVSVSGKHVWLSDENPAGSHPAPALEEFSTKAHGNATPERIIKGKKTKLDKPYGIALGLSGDNPITDDENRSGTFRLLRFASGSHGDVAPHLSVAGSLTGLDTPTLIATNSEGDIWVPNYLGNIVTRFGLTQHGNVAPAKDIAGSNTHLDNPEAIADFILPPTVTRAVHSHQSASTITFSWTAPLSHGGGLLGYRIRRSLHKSGPFTTLAVIHSKAATSYKIRRPSTRFYYLVQAYNEAGYAPSKGAIRPTS